MKLKLFTRRRETVKRRIAVLERERDALRARIAILEQERDALRKALQAERDARNQVTVPSKPKPRKSSKPKASSD